MKTNFEKKHLGKKTREGKNAKKKNTEPAVINTPNLAAKMMKNLRKKQSNLILKLEFRGWSLDLRGWGLTVGG